MAVCACGAEFDQPATGRRREKCSKCSPPRRGKLRRVPLLADVTKLAPQPPADTAGDDLVSVTRRQLEAAGVLGSPEAALTLTLAGHIAGGRATASGLAQLSRAFRDAKAEAMLDARPDADVIDAIFDGRTG